VPGNLLRLDGFRAAVCPGGKPSSGAARPAHPYPEERFTSRT